MSHLGTLRMSLVISQVNVTPRFIHSTCLWGEFVLPDSPLWQINWYIRWTVTPLPTWLGPCPHRSYFHSSGACTVGDTSVRPITKSLIMLPKNQKEELSQRWPRDVLYRRCRDKTSKVASTKFYRRSKKHSSSRDVDDYLIKFAHNALIPMRINVGRHFAKSICTKYLLCVLRVFGRKSLLQ